MKKDSKITVRVTGQERETLERLAAANDRSVSWYIQKAIAAFLRSYEQQRTNGGTDEDAR